MNETTNLNIRIDKELKSQADKVFSELGMNFTTAVTVFVRQAVREQKIPFEITLNPSGSSERGLFALRQLRAESENRGFISDDELKVEIRAAKNVL
jgi:DNA-damage-inducible protein J